MKYRVHLGGRRYKTFATLEAASAFTDQVAEFTGYILNIEEIKEDRPKPGKQYALTGGFGAKCIANGNTWAESVVEK